MPWATWLTPRLKNPFCRYAAVPARVGPGASRSGGDVFLAPPVLAGGGEGVDRVVVGVHAGERVGVVLLDGRAVVLRPVGDAALAVVFDEHVHPALADERDVADDAGGGVAGQVAHDVVLELL